MRELTNLGSAVLNPLVAANPSGPRITYYDDATGERIELSTATLANWAAKSGNLLRDEMGAGPGSRIAVLLPAHWQTAGVLFGAWWIGAEVVLDPATSDADVALCTADRLDEADEIVGGAGEVAVLSLDPFGKPVPDLPFGVTDYATSVRVHGDQIVAERSPGPALGGRSVTEVLEAGRSAATARGLVSTDRVMSTLRWDTDDRLTTGLLAVYVAGASLVQVANAADSVLQRRRDAEKVTRDLSATD